MFGGGWIPDHPSSGTVLGDAVAGLHSPNDPPPLPQMTDSSEKLDGQSFFQALLRATGDNDAVQARRAWKLLGPLIHPLPAPTGSQTKSRQISSQLLTTLKPNLGTSLNIACLEERYNISIHPFLKTHRVVFSLTDTQYYILVTGTVVQLNWC